MLNRKSVHSSLNICLLAYSLNILEYVILFEHLANELIINYVLYIPVYGHDGPVWIKHSKD